MVDNSYVDGPVRVWQLAWLHLCYYYLLFIRAIISTKNVKNNIFNLQITKIIIVKELLA